MPFYKTRIRSIRFRHSSLSEAFYDAVLKKPTAAYFQVNKVHCNFTEPGKAMKFNADPPLFAIQNSIWLIFYARYPGQDAFFYKAMSGASLWFVETELKPCKRCLRASIFLFFYAKKSDNLKV